MGKPTGFMIHDRQDPSKRPVGERIRDYREFAASLAQDELETQAARCMDCGIPFCHVYGCPVKNLIPNWNDMVYRKKARRALDLLHATNNLPEVTGRVCPAPCEPACTLAINQPAVTIKQIELQIVERGWEEGWILPEPAPVKTGKRVAIAGSGPAGLAAAQQLARRGHEVVVFERSDRVGGLLRYGIPDFKLEKWVIDRRVEQLVAEGVVFETGVEAGIDISGRYNANIGGEDFPANLDIWGPLAKLKITMDGQDKPMEGRFINNQLQVMSKYGAENFFLTTGVNATYGGEAFNGLYRRIDQATGQKQAPIVLTPIRHGGGDGDWIKMPLPRKPSDIPGGYSLILNKDGQEIKDSAEIDIEDGVISFKTGGREYKCDYSHKQIHPLYWSGNRMDTFQLTPTESGFTGKLMKEVGEKTEEIEVGFIKVRGDGGCGDDREWTYVYDALFSNGAVWIAKLKMKRDEADLTILIKDKKANMQGSLVDGILSGTGKYGSSTVSIRAEQVPGGFRGVMRSGSGGMVRDEPIILRNRPMRTGTGANW